jgi:hypothetical protein
MLKIAVIAGSTRPGRNGEAVAKWTNEVARSRKDAEFELVDIKDYQLPFLDEPMPPIMGQYSQPHTQRLESNTVRAESLALRRRDRMHLKEDLYQRPWGLHCWADGYNRFANFSAGKVQISLKVGW